MLEIENTFPYTRGFHVDGREYIFKAHETRIVPDSFLNSNGTIKFQGILRLKRKINETTGDSSRVYIKRDEEKYVNPNQAWEFVFEKDGEVFVTTKVTKFCEQHGLNPTSIRNYIKQNKPYMGWKISRRPISKEEKTDDKS